jgi:hypothetical protein
MKTFVLKLNKIVSLSLLMAGGIAVYGQDQGEVPGDQFSLEGALELFKKSASPEEFERLLNSSDSRVNNLDLNGDGEIDYIKVIDRNEGNVHAFILQALVSENESQDVAVIELEKLANGKAVLQISGDADVYGIETIIEPTQEVRVNAGTSTARTVVNVWAWPSVQYIYSPYYSYAWVSPWGWGMRPVWWNPWRPIAYHVYNPYWSAYRPYYSTCYTHRIVYAQHIYRPYRTTSVVVYNRHHTQINHYRTTHVDHNRGGRDRYDGGRDRYTDGRSGGRQNSNYSNHSDDRGRQRTTSNLNENSRSSSDFSRQQYQRKDDTNTRSSVTRDHSSDRNRSSSDFRNTPNTSQRNSNELQRHDTSRKLSGVTQNSNSSQQRLRSSSFESRSPQRTSSVQTNRREPSRGSNIQRSNGSHVGGTKSSGQSKRSRQ